MKVQNMISSNGNKIANQFELFDEDAYYFYKVFQSYDSIICKIVINRVTGEKQIYLDAEYWDYSRTTRKYRNLFLRETKKETQKKIDDGIYILTNLNE